jgi:undecaprenyl-diphosphatase
MLPTLASTHTAQTGPGLRQRLGRLDRALTRRVALDWRHPRWLVLALSALSLTGNYGMLWFVLAVVPWLAGAGRPRTVFLFVAGAVFATEIITYLIKIAVGRRRPPEAAGAAPALIPLPVSHSFPSSHASMGMVGAISMGSLYPPLLPALLALVAVLAFSRVYLGVHYVTDVVAGLLLGTALGVAYVLVSALAT